MKRKTRIFLAVLAIVCVVGAIVFAQQRGFGGRRGRRQIDLTERNGVPEWDVDPAFKKDVFTFVRIKYSSGSGYGRWGGDKWLTDFPDSDLNFSYRLQQLTSMKVNPMPVRVKLTDKEMFDYPFIYMLEVATLVFEDEEIEPLRRHLSNGGFLMVDDFWGERAWDIWAGELAKALPSAQYPIVDLPIEHELFHALYDVKDAPQIPSLGFWLGTGGGTSERLMDSRVVHVRAVLDDHQRIMVLMTHNTDFGDAFEREGDSRAYFERFAGAGYAFGVNTLLYGMTH